MGRTSSEVANTLNSIEVEWTALTDTGDANIDSYNLQYKLQSDSAWTDIQGQEGAYDTSTSGSVTGLIGGATYEF